MRLTNQDHLSSNSCEMLQESSGMIAGQVLLDESDIHSFVEMKMAKCPALY